MEEILSALGVNNNTTDINGVLCKGTYAQMGQAIYSVLKKHGCDITQAAIVKLTIDAYHANFGEGIVQPACENIYDVLSRLKKLGLKLAVVTTDDELFTKRCLQTLGIDKLFDYIYTDNNTYPAKPDAYCINDFCEREHLLKSEVVMVGDTLTDIQFARNGGIKVVGVSKSEGNKSFLEGKADSVIPDISYIFDVIE